MEPNVFMGYLIWGIASVLCSFEHEQYPSNNVDPWCLFIEYPNDSLVSLEILVELHNIPQCVKRYVMEPNLFFGYL